MVDPSAAVNHGSASDSGAEALPSSSSNSSYCGSCYGAEQFPGHCCNTCEEVRNAYSKRGWALLQLEDVEQCVKSGYTSAVKNVVRETTTISTTTMIDYARFSPSAHRLRAARVAASSALSLLTVSPVTSTLPPAAASSRATCTFMTWLRLGMRRSTFRTQSTDCSSERAFQGQSISSTDKAGS